MTLKIRKLPESELLEVKNPLIVNTRLAMLIGLNAAIVLRQVYYWLTKHNDIEHLKDGRIWIYNSYTEWQQGNFPFWSVEQIKRIFIDLEQEKKLILSSQSYNHTKYDRRKWYSIDFEELKRLEKPELVDISQDADPHDGTGDAAQSNDQASTIVGTELHDDDNNAEITQEIIPETTSLTLGRSSSVHSQDNPSIGFGGVIEPSVLIELVAGTRFKGLTSESLRGCVSKYGAIKTLEAIDILRSSKRAIDKDNLAGYIFGALTKGVTPPNNFVPFAEQKAAAAEKVLKIIQKENEGKDVDAMEQEKSKQLQGWWQSLPLDTQEKYSVEIRVANPFIKKDTRGRAFLDIAFSKYSGIP